jgi:hypothetical protein
VNSMNRKEELAGFDSVEDRRGFIAHWSIN